MLYDILFTLDPEGRFQSVSWGSREAEDLYRDLFQNWADTHRTADIVFELPDGKDSGQFQWEETTFFFQLLPAPDGNRYFMIKREDDRPYLLARALDQVTDGVQIYDKNACVVYFNRASRDISHIPSGVSVEGRHLLDLYNLDETVSTTMTALQTQAPVIDRVDSFRINDFSTAPIASANTSYPIFRNGELMGAVVFEQTAEIADKNIKKLEATRRALSSFRNKSPKISFSGYTFDNVIGGYQKLRDAVELAKRVAPQDSPVLLVGETGTGKEIFAQSIHHASRRSGRFLAINCAAVPETLIESLLFGTRKGSFTGSEDKAGYFEEAAGGTLFLDELNSMSLAMQSKILRVLQEKTFRRVGGNKDLKLDVRIISSCNEDPFKAISENTFRRDLFYRLSTVMIELPPLREHLEDLDELIRYHLESTAYQFVHSITQVEPGVYALLRAYHWPGNVRELFHVLDYAQNVTDSGVLETRHLPPYLLKNQTLSVTPLPSIDFSRDTLQSLMDDYEKQIIVQALEHCGCNISQTAQTLGILRQSLQYRIRKYGLIF